MAGILAKMIAESIVLLLALALMAAVVFGPEKHTKKGAILLALALTAAAMAVIHQLAR